MPLWFFFFLSSRASPVCCCCQLLCARPRTRVSSHFRVENIAKEIHSGRTILISQENFKRRNNVYNLDSPSRFVSQQQLSLLRGVVDQQQPQGREAALSVTLPSRRPRFLDDPVISGCVRPHILLMRLMMWPQAARTAGGLRCVTPRGLSGTPSLTR